LSETLEGAFQTTSGQELIQQLVDRKLDPYQAADIISNV